MKLRPKHSFWEKKSIHAANIDAGKFSEQVHLAATALRARCGLQDQYACLSAHEHGLRRIEGARIRSTVHRLTVVAMTVVLHERLTRYFHLDGATSAPETYRAH
jgi:hypothetical protein